MTRSIRPAVATGHDFTGYTLKMLTNHTQRSLARPALATLACAIAFVACRNSSTEQPGGIACTADYRYGLNVTVVDSLTGIAVARPLLITVTEGTFADTSQAARSPGDFPFTSWPLSGERAGSYTVRVRAAGYQDWQQNGVRVSRDVCHVMPVALTARLKKAP